MMKHLLSFSMLLVALTACQPLASPAPAAAPVVDENAAPPASAAASVDSAAPAAATESEAIWGQVPKQCACHADREPLSNVASQLEYAQVDANFQLQSTSQGFEIFSVTFNPSVVSAARITQILQQAGAIIIPSPE
jgi:hypothetical protein